MFGIANSSVRSSVLAATTAVSLFLFSCSSSSNDEGPCEYERVDTMAEVIELKPHPDGEGRISIIMDFKASPLAFEPQELGSLKELKIDHDFLVRNHIEIGNKYEVVVSTITSGNCTPQFVSFNHGFE